jgi:hypothetical protein
MLLDGVDANGTCVPVCYARSVTRTGGSFARSIMSAGGSVARSTTSAGGLARYLYLNRIARDGKEIRVATFALLAAQCEVFESKG